MTTNCTTSPSIIPLDLKPGIPKLASIYYNPTAYCNLKCSHCWIAPPYKKSFTAPNPKELTLEQVSSLYDQGRALGLTATKLTGGEPLLRYGIKDILWLIHEKGINLQMETNATLIDKDMASLLGRIYREDRNMFLSVSIDGDEEAHEKQRGVKGCFKDTILGVENLLEHDIHVQVIFSVNRNNRADIDRVAEICQRLRVNSMKINFVNDIERATTLGKNNKLLSVDETLALNQHIIEEIAPKYVFKVITNLPPAFKPIADFACAGRCGIFGILGVLGDGSVSICGIGTSTPELIVGNVKRDRLKILWEEGHVFQSIRKEVPHEFEGVCGACVLKNRCLGECRADAYYKKKSFKAPFDFCQKAYEEGKFPSKWLIQTHHHSEMLVNA